MAEWIPLLFCCCDVRTWRTVHFDSWPFKDFQLKSFVQFLLVHIQNLYLSLDSNPIGVVDTLVSTDFESMEVSTIELRNYKTCRTTIFCLTSLAPIRFSMQGSTLSIALWSSLWSSAQKSNQIFITSLDLLIL